MGTNHPPAPLRQIHPQPNAVGTSNTAPQHRDDTQPCPQCGRIQTVLPIVWGRAGVRLAWQPCGCQESQIEAQIGAREAVLARAQQQLAAHQRAERPPADGSTPLSVFAEQGMVLDRFRADWLTTENDWDGPNPYERVCVWLDAILAYGDPTGSRTDLTAPPQMLYLYNSVHGVGKTHLAVGAGLAAAARDRRVVIIREEEFLCAYGGCTLEWQRQIVALPAQGAWLTIIDDLGRKGVSQRGDEQSTIADVWDSVLGQRYEYQGWTIITSNWLPSELEARGTISPAALSRLSAMIGEPGVVFVDGRDRRVP